MSKSFAECASEMKNARVSASLDTTTYSKKITDEELAGLWDWLNSNGRVSMKDVLTHAGMTNISTILCRWPRPSELGRMAVNFAGEDITYHRMIMTLEASRPDSAFSALIGTRGSNFYDITKKNDLMYLWLHKSGEGERRYLYIYATSRKKVMATSIALSRQFAQLNIVESGKAELKTMKLTARSPDFGPRISKNAV